MIALFKTWWTWLWRRPAEVEATPPPLPVSQPVKPGDLDDDLKLDFSFRETILDDLDVHFKILRRFKRADLESWNLYSQIGCYLIPSTSYAYYDKVEPWFNEHRPSFGAVSIFSVKDHTREDEKDKILPRFFYFTKYKPQKAPAKFERTNHGDVYVMTLYYDDLEKLETPSKAWAAAATRRSPSLRFPAEFAVAVAPDGSVSPLRERKIDYAKIRAKRCGGTGNGRVHRGQIYDIPAHRYRLPDFYVAQAEDHKRDPRQSLVELFIMAANFYEGAALGGITRVNVAKDDLNLVISVDPKYTARFFHDRQKTILPNGSKRRIFHSVRPHLRVVHGEDRYVRYHFRGERDFDWNGYRVKISVPYRDQVQVADFDIGAVAEEKLDDMTGMISTKALGRRLRELTQERRQ